MIPKTIHYCWVGGNPKTPLALKCIESWKRFCPDYKIIEWNESNYDFFKNRYMAEAYESKKWGFVPDYARLDIVYNHGGIYLDTDVEIIRNIDDLLNLPAFAGLQRKGIVALGLGFGSEKGNSIIKELRDDYDNLSFFNEDGSINLTTSPKYQSDYMIKYHGMSEQNCIQNLEDKIIIFPIEYFNPMNPSSGTISITNNTYSIHHYAASWASASNKRRTIIYKLICRVFGENTAKTIRSKFGRKKKA